MKSSRNKFFSALLGAVGFAALAATAAFAADAPAKKAEIKPPAGVEGEAQCHKHGGHGGKHHEGKHHGGDCDKHCCMKGGMGFHGKGMMGHGGMGRELVATSDGGVIVLQGKELIKFDKNLKEVAKAELPMPEGMKEHWERMKEKRQEMKKEMKKEAKDGKKEDKK